MHDAACRPDNKVNDNDYLKKWLSPVLICACGRITSMCTRKDECSIPGYV
jgi:hypothetical protein